MGRLGHMHDQTHDQMAQPDTEDSIQIGPIQYGVTPNPNSDQIRGLN